MIFKNSMPDGDPPLNYSWLQHNVHNIRCRVSWRLYAYQISETDFVKASPYPSKGPSDLKQNGTEKHHYLAQFFMPFQPFLTTFQLIKISWDPTLLYLWFFKLIFPIFPTKGILTCYGCVLNSTSKWFLLFSTILFEITWAFLKMWTQNLTNKVSEIPTCVTFVFAVALWCQMVSSMNSRGS